MVATKLSHPKPWAGRDQYGYGGKIPTARMVQLKDGIWRRVYAMCFSNVQSLYVLIDHEEFFLDGYCEEKILNLMISDALAA
jgi:hypothetical protein